MSYRFVQARYDSYGNRIATKALVVHMTEGSGTEADVDYLANNPLRGVSVHFVILKTGEIVQMLGWNRIAGSINPNELRTTDDPPYTSPDGARVVYGATLRDAIMGSWINGGLLAVEVGGKAVDGPNQAQSEALVRLVADVRTRYPGLPVLGHRDFTSTKGCPGHKVLWASLGGHGRPVRSPPKPRRIRWAFRSSSARPRRSDPLSAFGTATLKGGWARPHLGRHVGGRRHEHARRRLARASSRKGTARQGDELGRGGRGRRHLQRRRGPGGQPAARRDVHAPQPSAGRHAGRQGADARRERQGAQRVPPGDGMSGPQEAVATFRSQLTDTPHVWVAPGRVSGEPCLGGHRLPTRTVVDHYDAAGLSPTMDGYRITRFDVLVCCWYEARYGRSRTRKAAWSDWLAENEDALWTGDWSGIPFPPRAEALVPA
jgi:uncharacterized protein (DUF433 family)